MSSKLSKPLSPGDVITQDMPIIHIINSEYKSNYCDNCCRRSDQLKRCTKCLQMYYCGKECQRNDWKYHKNECPLYRHPMSQKLRSDDCLQFWLRLYLSVQNIPTFATEKYRLFDGSEVSLRDIKVRDIDLTDKEMRNNVQSVYSELNALDMTYDPKEVLHWLSWFITVTTTHIMAGNPELIFKELILKDIARGFYAQYLTLGHSCQPNSAFIFNTRGQSVQLRAMRPIAAGEEITISRVPLSRDRAYRQWELKLYSIVCECDKCVHHLDRRVDYERLQTSKFFPIHTIADGFDFMVYLRQLLADLDVVYGDYHPDKTSHMMLLIRLLSGCPMITQSILDEIKAYLLKAIDVTFLSDCPFRAQFIESTTLAKL